MEKTKRNLVQINRLYTLEYIMAQKTRLEWEERVVGSCESYHDISIKKWRLTIQLDTIGLWFLSVFICEDGTFDMYSLDEEAADDAHYNFTEEQAIREILYEEGDNDLYFHQILIRFAEKNGAGKIYSLIKPYITTGYHFESLGDIEEFVGTDIPNAVKAEEPEEIGKLQETETMANAGESEKIKKSEKDEKTENHLRKIANYIKEILFCRDVKNNTVTAVRKGGTQAAGNDLKQETYKKAVISEIIKYRKIKIPGSTFPETAYRKVCGTEHDKIYNAFQCTFLSLLAIRMEEYRKKLMENYSIAEDKMIMSFPEESWLYGPEVCERLMFSLENIYPELAAFLEEHRVEKQTFDCAALLLMLTKSLEQDDSMTWNLFRNVFSDGLVLVCRGWSAQIREEVYEEICKEFHKKEPGRVLRKPVRIEGELGDRDDYDGYDEEYGFWFRIFSDDNYYHGGSYRYSYVDDPEKDLPQELKCKNVLLWQVKEIYDRLPEYTKKY